MSTVTVTVMEEAYRKAKEKEVKKMEKAVKEAETSSAIASTTAEQLPDLNKIEVAEVVIPQYDKEKAKVEADEKKQYAESAASKLTQIRENLEKIRAAIRKIEVEIKANPDLAMAATTRSSLASLKATEVAEMAKEKQILGIKDEAVKAHIEFSAFLNEIKDIDPSRIGEVQEIWNQVHQNELRKIISKEQLRDCKFSEKMGPIFFNSQISVSIGGTDGQKALEAELRKLTNAAKNSKAASIKMRGSNADLSGFILGKPASYYLFFPKRTEKAHVSEGGIEIPERKFYEGHALVELRDLNKGKFYVDKGKKIFRKPNVIADVRDACGSLSWMVGKKWLPLLWINKGKVIPSIDKETGKPKRLEKEDFDNAIRMIRTIRAAVILWRDEHKPVENAITEALLEFCGEFCGEKKLPEKTPEEIIADAVIATATPTISSEEAAERVTAVPDADMSGVRVEKISKSKKEKAKKA